MSAGFRSILRRCGSTSSFASYVIPDSFSGNGSNFLTNTMSAQSDFDHCDAEKLLDGYSSSEQLCSSPALRPSRRRLRQRTSIADLTAPALFILLVLSNGLWAWQLGSNERESTAAQTAVAAEGAVKTQALPGTCNGAMATAATVTVSVSAVGTEQSARPGGQAVAQIASTAYCMQCRMEPGSGTADSSQMEVQL